ncbi:hypothetical protein CPB84DRAFT_1743352 [Gymnopilus junonius]|uniref:CxC2-like cysteine cluster KDZ transposase-associated domain-containing protein n=1 Tax=Gymnopilus junonius TaxID=109634 RepID=A0A9P5NXV8_GYMJU|nr:hypothetical protein CPB84DRAFT_1743352 [Gymnopilus junonius]
MSLGHRIHLGHPAGEKCPAPSSAYGGKFTVLDLNGVHSLDVSFCDFASVWMVSSNSQVSSNSGHIPASSFYQILSFESKATVFEFHKTLSRLTDNTGTRIPKGGLGVQPPLNVEAKQLWTSSARSSRFLYGLFIGLDANFHLKRKIVSSHAADPGLSQGWAYFVQEDEFKNFLHKYGKLIVQERARHGGYAASGVATCDCTRHDMKRPNGVCDIQKGNGRYLNMDFIFLLSLLIHITVLYITVSYDIACQWSIYFWDRMKIYPEFLQLLPALTDGEGVERGWDCINPIATSTCEMGPGSRRDTLDAHFGDWNWQKTCSMSTFLLRQIKEAILELEEKLRIHEEFTHNLSEEDVAEWMMMVEAWENDHSKPNPFEVTLKALSQATVRRQLAEEEAKALNEKTAFTMHEEVSASQLITMGLELENQQHWLRVDADLLGIHAMDDQKTKLMLVRTLLNAKLKPGSRFSTYIPLLLPSSIPGDIPCDYRLKHIEWRLRYAQCGDSLNDLRDALCLRSFILIDKSRFQRGQRQNTRSQGIVERIQAKVAAAVKRYRTARKALEVLAPITQQIGWELRLPELKDEDVRPLTQEKSTKAKGKGKTGGSSKSEGRQTISWIWTRMGGEVDFNEKEHLHERSSGVRVEHIETVGGGGRVAYAREQSAQFRTMRRHCEEAWRDVDKYIQQSGQEVQLASVEIERDEEGEEEEMRITKDVMKIIDQYDLLGNGGAHEVGGGIERSEGQ